MRRGGEANNAIRELASVSQTHTHTNTYDHVCLLFISSASHIDGNKGRKAASRKDGVRIREARKVADRKRETELKGCLKKKSEEP